MRQQLFLLFTVCLAAPVALSGDSRKPVVDAPGAQQALERNGVPVSPELVKRALPAIDAAVQRKMALEDELERLSKDLAATLDRKPGEAQAIARTVDQLAEEARLKRDVLLSTDATWRMLVASAPPEGWERPDHRDERWTAAVAEGAFGAQPWGPVNGFVRRTPAQWVWHYASQGRNDLDTVLFRQRFSSPKREAMLVITADNTFEAFLDGKPVARGTDWTRPVSTPVKLEAGAHVLAVKVINQGGPGGLLVDLR